MYSTTTPPLFLHSIVYKPLLQAHLFFSSIRFGIHFNCIVFVSHHYIMKKKQKDWGYHVGCLEDSVGEVLMEEISECEMNSVLVV